MDRESQTLYYQNIVKYTCSCPMHYGKPKLLMQSFVWTFMPKSYLDWISWNETKSSSMWNYPPLSLKKQAMTSWTPQEWNIKIRNYLLKSNGKWQPRPLNWATHKLRRTWKWCMMNSVVSSWKTQHISTLRCIQQDPCIIATIKKWIEELASVSILEKLDMTYKTWFADCFPSDIPHAKDPTEVYHHIEVQPRAPISVSQAYSCPRKYWDG